MDSSVANLMLLNQERRRADLPPAACATIQQVYEILTNLTDVELKPPGEKFGRFSFKHKADRLDPEIVPCLVAEARVNELPVRADNTSVQWVQSQFNLMLPLIHNLGWVALHRQCGYGKVNLTIQKEIIEDRTMWAVVVEEDGEQTLQGIFAGRGLAQERLSELSQQIEDNRSYPSLAIFPQTVFHGTTSPLLEAYLLNAYDGWSRELTDRQVLAAQWIITGSTSTTAVVLTQDLRSRGSGYGVGVFHVSPGREAHSIAGPEPHLGSIKVAFLNAILDERNGPYPRIRCKFQLFE